MVGMQASLHTSMRDIEADLTTTKNESEPLSTDDILHADDDDELGDSDEFGESDPEEHIGSPPSNDSNQRIHASLDDADELGEVARAPGAPAPASSGEFAEVFDQLNAENAERAQALKQQNVYSRQSVQSSTAPVKSAAPNVAPFGRR
jgi:hypothetical protein